MIEQTVTGKKFRILADVTSRIWHVISFWTKAQDVEFNNGNNAQATLGNIAGISDSLTSTSSNVAASAKAVKVLNDKIVNQIGNLNEQINNIINNIYNAIVAQGVTPDGKTPADLVSGINSISGLVKAYQIYYSTSAPSTINIPVEYRNGMLILQCGHDNRTPDRTITLSGREPVYRRHVLTEEEATQTYCCMTVDIFQLNGDSSVTLNFSHFGTNISAFTITLISKKGTPVFISNAGSINAAAKTVYLAINAQDYRSPAGIRLADAAYSNIRTSFSESEALYGVHGNWHCHNCAAIVTVSAGQISIPGTINHWIRLD